MIVSLKHKFAYMPVTKTGTTSMEQVLSEYGATKSHGPVRNKYWINRHDIALRKDHADFFVFATVRNPFSHEESQWRYFEKELSFEEHIKTKCCYENTFWHKLKQDSYDPPEGWVKFKLDAFVRLEHMEEDFQKLPFVDRIAEMPHLRKRQQDNSLHWTEEMLDIVRKNRRIDFLEFGYDLAGSGLASCSNANS